MLTLDDLKKMPPHTIFATGQTTIEHPWYGQAPQYPPTVDVKWIAIRGFIHDWAIYHSFDTNLMFYGDDHITSPEKMIANHGAKLHDMEKVQELVPCDTEALEMYRH